ncbi:acyltransferase 3 [Fibrella aestuarina BUZ 2]|uniref:Acyltransferase 3 n=1 Tax=Fibrella aestuarina BUZ 2 TaxID=1166018 RepID=I0KDN3_9BACT|nr:acyltransferase [Fibrella aestuarina]CCH02236.1 acyltransferase 3 [Fibrella aestuarina BUZ 2]
MTPSPAQPAVSPDVLLTGTARRYDLDWLRIGAILILLFYHTGMIYVSWGWHIKSTEHSQPMEEVMRWLHRWRMPLLFFISGGGTWFALRKRTYGRYAGERFRRLFVPLVFGMFVVVPPQIYIEWLFRERFAGSYLDFYPEVFRFQSYRDGGQGGAFSWHHLWFICYLFFYSLLSIPVFRWLKSDRGQRTIDRLAHLLDRPGGALALVVPLWLNDLVLGGFFPNETHALIDDWAYFMKNLLLFWYGYVLVSRVAFWQLLTDQRRIFLAATVVCTVILYGWRATISDETTEASAVLRTLYSFNSIGLTWFSVLATVGYGYRYLNVNKPILPHLTEAVYPFYILHQTVIVVIGYWALNKLKLGVWGGFWFISLSSLALCVLLYVALIRPLKPLRVVFGLK